MSFTKKQLLPDEQLICLQHQHVIVLLKPILLSIVCAVVLSILSYGLRSYWSMSYWIMSLCLIPLGVLLWNIMVRNGREYIVTDRRVVRNEGVFSSSSFDAPLDKINNVFHEQSLMGRMFKYGRVGLETASEQGTTIFDHIPHPVEFKNCIVRQREVSKGSGNAPIAVQATQNVAQLLDDLARLRDRNVITQEEFEAKKKALLDKI
jgi:uncharacterized membrane protein YdbT with pleckstrin-like domain